MPVLEWEQVSRHLSSNLPLVIYRKPDDSIINVLLQPDDRLRYVSGESDTGFVFAPFDTTKKSVLFQPHGNLYELAGNGPAGGILEKSIPVRNDKSSKQAFLDLVEAGITAINSGALEKVVLTRKLEIVWKEDGIGLLRRLLARYDRAFCYLWHHPKVGTWVGATPEILLRVRNQVLQTVALAGTLPYEPGREPLWGEKEEEEQAMVTRYIEETLRDKVSDLCIHGRESVRAGDLWHLRTVISATVPNGPDEILNALHPTPAVCGLPVAGAKSFISAHENYDREFYTGYLGELNMGPKKQETDLFVNLRCAQLAADKATVYVGCGITGDSIPEREWEETGEKAKTMLAVMGRG